MRDELGELKRDFFDSLQNVDNSHSLKQLRVRFLGRKGRLTLLLRSVGTLAPELRPTVGREANQLRQEIETALKEKGEALKKEAETKISVDPTLPAPPFSLGREHPINRTIEEIISIFLPLGFQVATGPEIETDYYNFEALNFPPDHPARDEQDSFQIGNGKYLLRTQTSPVQIRIMERMKKKSETDVMAMPILTGMLIRYLLIR